MGKPWTFDTSNAPLPLSQGDLAIIAIAGGRDPRTEPGTTDQNGETS